MSSSNVRNIESLEAFHGGIIRLASDLETTLEEIRLQVQHAEEYFSANQPAYWRRQLQLAERELNEAKDNLAQKRASTRPNDRPAASEATRRVRIAEQRLQMCQKKQRDCRAWSLEISRQCDSLLGPLADVVEHCELILPAAARELRSLIEQLRLYAEKSSKPP